MKQNQPVAYSTCVLPIGAPYLWVDLTNPEEIYKNWQHDQPDAAEDGSENCVDQDMGSGKWADTKCTEIRGFACQMDKCETMI